MLRASAALSAAALGAWLTGCADGHGEDLPPAQTRAAVVDGEPSPYGGEDDAVLLLHTEVDGEELVCSASLVAKNLALTARHCVSQLIPGAFICNLRGELEPSEGETEPGRLGAHLPADSLGFYTGPAENRRLAARGREVISTLSETICVNDVAYVVLDRELDLPIFPLRTSGRALPREDVTLVGYGLDNEMYDSLIVPPSALERNRKSDLTVFDLGPELVEDVTSAPPRTIVLAGPSGCLGDSGGPLLATRTRALLGVYSILAGRSCLEPDVRHWFAHVPSFELLTEEAFAAAGAEPAIEVEPSGDAGAAGEAGTAGTPNAAGTAGAAGESGATSAGGAAGNETGSAGDAGSGGHDEGALEPQRKRSSSGCNLGGASPAPHAGLLAFAAGLLLARRSRRQCRPSSGSESI